jgi:hypothetical protein
MNTPEKQQLLRDTIEDTDYQQFRVRLRRQVLADYRHRTVSRNPAWLLALAACLAVFLTFLLLPRPHAPQLSRTKGFADVIRTGPLNSEQRLRSVSSPALLVNTTNPNTVTSPPEVHFSIVRTSETDANLLYLSDQELLAFFPGKPVGLVTTSDHSGLLVFANPDDALAYGYPVSTGAIP